MTADVPFSRPRRPEHMPGDAVPAPRELMAGPGRIWEAEPRWRWVEIRIGGRWVPGEVERWRLHQGSTCWIALVRWGAGTLEWGWYLHSPETIRQAPRPPRTTSTSGSAAARPYGGGAVRE